MNQLNPFKLLIPHPFKPHPQPPPKILPAWLLLISIICLTSFTPTLSIFSAKTHYPAGGDIISVEILPNGNILKVSENYILTTYDPGTYAEVSSVNLTLEADGQQICDAALIDANNIMIVTYNRMWLVNMQTGAETNKGEGLTSTKEQNPVQ